MIQFKELGIQPYEDIWQKMKSFTVSRRPDTNDEFWLLQHLPVYTQGQAGKPEHILTQNHIPIIQTDRGGQVTYHGPGQLVGYVLMDIKQRHMGIRTLVSKLESSLISLLHHYHIEAESQCHAPGVYVNGNKIASIGLRVKNGCTYHGIALNVNMDLTPFKNINPCGFRELKMTQLSDFAPNITMPQVIERFKIDLTHQFES